MTAAVVVLIVATVVVVSGNSVIMLLLLVVLVVVVAVVVVAVVAGVRGGIEVAHVTLLNSAAVVVSFDADDAVDGIVVINDGVNEDKCNNI